METLDVLSLAVVGCILSALGNGLTAMVFGRGSKAGRPGWRGVVYVTLWAHPILAGMLVGLIPGMPSPAFMGDALAGSVFWYALAGVFSSTLYDAVSSFIK